MKNCIKRATLLTKGNCIEKTSLPLEFFLEQHTETPDLSLSKNEKDTILDALEQTGSNKSEAAKLLKITRKTLYNKIKRYGID